MSLRYLIGPVTTAFANQCLAEERRQGNCLTFHSSEEVDLKISADDSWHDVTSACRKVGALTYWCCICPTLLFRLACGKPPFP